MKKAYEKYCLPYLIDLVCSNQKMDKLRQSVVPLAYGNVLEIGIGSGSNIKFYDTKNVSKIWGLEPSLELQKIAKKQNFANLNIEWLLNDAASIPLSNQSIDSVVITFTLCSISDWQTALSEMRRVLKPNGKIYFSEHGLAPDQSIQNWQKRITPYWKHFAGNCHLDRPIDTMLTEFGFQIEEMKTEYLKSELKIAGFHYVGFAKLR